jgi:ketosteroid isomerase-like protein
MANGYGSRMTESSPRLALVQEAYERFNDGDIAGVLDLLDPEVELPDVIHNEVLRGREAVKQNWERQFAIADHSAIAGSVMDAGSAVLVVVYHQLYEKAGGPIGHGVAAVHRLTFRGDLIAKMEFTGLDRIPESVRQLLR